MFDTANQAVIFLPLLVIVALTFAAFVRMAVARSAAVKHMEPGFYRAHQGGAEPEAAVVAVRHYSIMFELPTLFYAAGLTAFVLGAVTGWVLVWAWAFVAARLIQSAIHLTYNNPAHRGGAFVLSMVFMIALWVTVAIHIFARV